MFTYYFPIHPFRLVPMFSGITPQRSIFIDDKLLTHGLQFVILVFSSTINNTPEMYYHILLQQMNYVPCHIYYRSQYFLHIVFNFQNLQQISKRKSIRSPERLFLSLSTF